MSLPIPLWRDGALAGQEKKFGRPWEGQMSLDNRPDYCYLELEF